MMIGWLSGMRVLRNILDVDDEPGKKKKKGNVDENLPLEIRY